jgi:1-acyl-sn-glycerol-3-phosphate acyltransferase
MSRFWYAFRYYLAWVLFGLAALTLNLLVAPALLWPRREQLARPAQSLIRRSLATWVAWLGLTGVLRVQWHAVPRRLPAGALYVSNHPTLLDALILLTRLDRAVCVFKPSLLYNPVIGPIALLAGYLPANRPAIVRSAGTCLRTGQSLLIFPEGTRTSPERALNPLKSGFAAIARRAQVPVQIMRLQASAGLLTHGQPWWKLPQAPAWITIWLDSPLPIPAGHQFREWGSRLEARWQSDAGAMV